jgi:putative membrane protein
MVVCIGFAVAFLFVRALDARRRVPMHRLIAVALFAAPLVARAHEAEQGGAMEPWVAACLAIAAAVYLAGLRNLWRRAGIARGVSWRQAVMFGVGWLTLAAALGGPIEDWSSRSFAAHMLQHELMMLMAAPLLAASRPLGVFAWGVPCAARRRLRALTTPASLRACWRWLTAPLWATLLSIAVLWMWHAPRLFDLAVTHRGWHALQHASFFVTALAFWWALRPSPPNGVGRTIACLFIAMIVTGALGGLLSFADAPWYAAYAEDASPFGWSRLEDQQVGGLVMWIPGGAVYMAVALMRLRDALVPVRARAMARHARM